MTIEEALESVEMSGDTRLDDEVMIKWLSELDRRIADDVLSDREGFEEFSFEGYGSGTDRSTELLVGEPYEGIYPMWLRLKCDETRADWSRYNSDMAVFQDRFVDFSHYISRKYRQNTDTVFRR